MDEEKKEIIEVEKVNDIENTENTEIKENSNVEPKTETKVKEEPKKERKGFCIAAMVLGIVALVLFCVWYISIPCAILAVIFGILGIKTIHKGMAIAGLVTGTVSLAIWIFILILISVFGFAIGIFDAFDDDYDSYRSHHDYDWYDYY